MAYNLPYPVRRIKLVGEREDWTRCEPHEAEAYCVEWGAHGKPWTFYAIVDSADEGEEMLEKLSFIG